MIKEIITDRNELALPSVNCDDPELIDQIVQDLLDTARHHKDNCVGLAANQIGYRYRIFVALTLKGFAPFINPEVKCYFGGKKQGFESCLSLLGEDPVKVRRHKGIKLRLENGKGGEALISATGLMARCIQHELDHCDGVVI
jgi:peptide deformylase